MYMAFNFEWKVHTLNMGDFKKLQNYLKTLSSDTQIALAYFSLLQHSKLVWKHRTGGRGRPIPPDQITLTL